MAYGHSVVNLLGRLKEMMEIPDAETADEEKHQKIIDEERGKEMDVIPYYEVLGYERGKMKLKPKLLVIFGSITKGDFGVGSDVDILIVSDLLPKNFQKRLKILFLLDDTFAPIEPVGYTSI